VIPADPRPPQQNPETGKQRLEELRNEIPLPVLELYRYAGEACRKGDYLEAERVIA